MNKRLLKRKPASKDAEMEEEKLEVNARAYRLCREYLRGSWSEILENEFKLTVLGGGLTNKLYICEIPECRVKEGENIPHKVLLRLYGLIIQDFAAQIQESVVFSILSERNIGPQLFAVFPGGRLEEYLPCRTLVTKDLHNPDISTQVAKRMASYHKLVMPVKKEPTCILDKLQAYYEGLQHIEFKNDAHKRALLKEFNGLDILKEMNYVKQLVKETDSPVVFCHNDVQEGNLLYTDNKVNPVQMIDFEYSSYNYRGFDTGNHFCEWVYDYSHPKWPFYSVKPKNYPSKQQQMDFIQAYLEEHFSTFSNNSRTDRQWTIEFMLMEANRFALLSHIFWALWSVVQAKMSDINFGYMEYALVRMDAYFQQKATIE